MNTQTIIFVETRYGLLCLCLLLWLVHVAALAHNIYHPHDSALFQTPALTAVYFFPMLNPSLFVCSLCTHLATAHAGHSVIVFQACLWNWVGLHFLTCLSTAIQVFQAFYTNAFTHLPLVIHCIHVSPCPPKCSFYTPLLYNIDQRPFTI